MSGAPGTDELCRVGVDLVAVQDVAASVERFGERYLGRIYTDHERACCSGDPAVTAAGLAARFAAKEAVLKVLRPVGRRPEWRAIEVVRQPGGACEVALSGEATRLAADAGVRQLAVSLTHEAGMAAAVAVAVLGPPPVPLHPTEGSMKQGE